MSSLSVNGAIVAQNRTLAVNNDRDTGDSVVAVVVGQELTVSVVPYVAPWACRIGWHPWTLLLPSDEEKEEVRRLVSRGQGSLNDLGAKPEDVLDRVCSKCFASDNRLAKYIDALRTARGEI